MAVPTPGPWIVGPFDMIWPASDVEFSDGKWREKIPEPRIIASASKGNLLPDEDRANAHLMAAAPELLEALIMALPYVESCEDAPAYKPMAVKLRVKMMRAAIAKAEGQSTRRDGPVLREGVA